MAAFDRYVERVREYVADVAQSGARVREYRCGGDPDRLRAELPVRVGPGASSGLILRGDSFAELGSPQAGSCAFPLWTDRPALVDDGRVTLIGPRIGESAGESLPFGQVLIAGGPELGERDHEALEQSQYVSDQIEGYMIRSTPGRMWSRVHKDAVGAGFDFEALGKALLAIFRSAIPRIQAMEVLFVTSSRQDVERLAGIAEQVRTIGRNIVRDAWLARGYDILECGLEVDCRSCTDKPACDDIRDVIKIRKRKLRQAATS